jgi:hypothetical protein
VEDDLLGSGAHTIALRWHLVDAPLQFDEPERRLTLTLPFGTVRVSIEGPSDLRLAIHRGSSDDSSYTGWESRYYGERVPRPTLEAIGRFELPVRLVTRIDLGAAADSKLSIA